MARLQIFFLYKFIWYDSCFNFNNHPQDVGICLILVRIIKYSSTKYPYCLVLTGFAALDALLRQASSLLSGLDEEEVQSLGCRFLDDEHRSVNSKMAKWGKVPISLLVINRQPGLMKMMDDVYTTSVKQNGLLRVSAVKPRNAQLLQAYFPQRRRTTLWGWFSGQSIEM